MWDGFYWFIYFSTTYWLESNNLSSSWRPTKTRFCIAYYHLKRKKKKKRRSFQQDISSHVGYKSILDLQHAQLNYTYLCFTGTAKRDRLHWSLWGCLLFSMNRTKELMFRFYFSNFLCAFCCVSLLLLVNGLLKTRWSFQVRTRLRNLHRKGFGEASLKKKERL